jgi:hypothetical protein
MHGQGNRLTKLENGGSERPHLPEAFESGPAGREMKWRRDREPQTFEREAPFQEFTEFHRHQRPYAPSGLLVCVRRMGLKELEKRMGRWDSTSGKASRQCRHSETLS